MTKFDAPKTREALGQVVISGIIPEIIEFLIPEYFRELKITMPGYHLARLNGLREMVDQITKVDEGLMGACRGGWMKLADYMIKKGAHNFNGGLYGACRGGYMDLVELMIAKGARDFGGGLIEACEGGFIGIAECMIEKGAIYVNAGFKSACRGGHFELVQFLISKGCVNYNWGLYYACQNDHQDIVRLMIEYGADICRYCGNKKHAELVNFKLDDF